VDPFRWEDGERLVRFGRGTVAEAGALLGDGYALLTTERAAAAAPLVAEGAGQVHLVGSGLVDELAGALLDRVQGERLVALGGGRVIDTAKALAAARPGRRVAAVPTTLSGAEMTRVHRHAAGVPADTPRVRPAIVLCDPALCASQPEAELAASALNALGHAAEGPCTPLANPVSTLSAHRAATLIAGAFSSDDGDPDRDALALGALLAGHAIDSARYGLHHVLAQTLVRIAGVGHALANAVMLEHTLGALAERFPDQLWALEAAVGEDPSELARRLCELTGTTRLSELGVTRAALEQCADVAAGRAELELTPPSAAREELLALYTAAW